MSLRPQTSFAIPEETARVARMAFPKGNRYMKMRDELGPLFQDEDFADLFPRRGQPAAAPWRLALVTIMQFAENLTDRQAADAVRARLDWKYALNLELEDAGFDFSVLGEFRERLLSSDVLVDGQEQHEVEMVGPMRIDKSWQARDPEAFDLAQFTIDWDVRQVTCPQGKQSYKWTSKKGPRGKPAIQVNFNKRECLACGERSRCTRSKHGPRSLTLHPRPQHEALQTARERQQTETFKDNYKTRAGVARRGAQVRNVPVPFCPAGTGGMNSPTASDRY